MNILEISYLYWLSDFEQKLEKIPPEYIDGARKSKEVHKDLFFNTTFLLYGSELIKNPNSQQKILFQLLQKIDSTYSFEIMKGSCRLDLNKSMILASQFLDNFIKEIPESLIELISEHSRIIQEIEEIEKLSANEDHIEKLDNEGFQMEDGALKPSTASEKTDNENQKPSYSLDKTAKQYNDSSIQELLKLLKNITAKYEILWGNISEQEIDMIVRKSSKTPLMILEKMDLLQNENNNLFNHDLSTSEFNQFIVFLKENPDVQQAIDELGKIRQGNMQDQDNRQISSKKGGVRSNRKRISNEINPERLTIESLLPLSLGKHPLALQALKEEKFHEIHYGQLKSNLGSFVLVVDTSGSTSNFKNQLNGLNLSFLIDARKKNRNVLFVPFSGEGVYELIDLSNATLYEIIKAASIWYGGGTEPYLPFIEALEKVKMTQNFEGSDFIIITDAAFGTAPNEFISLVEEGMKKDMKILAFIIDQQTPGNCSWATKYFSVQSNGLKIITEKIKNH